MKNLKIGIIGLGYVGLPLAVEFGKKYPTLGFDINQSRVNQLKDGKDSTLECTSDELSEAINLDFSSNLDDIQDCNFYIVTVPTPITDANTPDLTPLKKASEALGSIISHGDVVVFESTVYPGATEEVCLPIIEKISGLKFNTDFFAGYSPERINTGVALAKAMTSAVAKKVNVGQNTASPSLISNTIIHRVSASVPFAQVIACFTPTYSASLSSNSKTSGPIIYLPWSNTL